MCTKCKDPDFEIQKIENENFGKCVKKKIIEEKIQKKSNYDDLIFEELTEKNVGPYEKHQIKRQWKDGELYSQSVIAKRQSTPNDPIDFPKGEAIKTVELWSPTYSKTTEVLEWY